MRDTVEAVTATELDTLKWLIFTSIKRLKSELEPMMGETGFKPDVLGPPQGAHFSWTPLTSRSPLPGRLGKGPLPLQLPGWAVPEGGCSAATALLTAARGPSYICSLPHSPGRTAGRPWHQPRDRVRGGLQAWLAPRPPCQPRPPRPSCSQRTLCPFVQNPQHHLRSNI